MIGHQLGDFSNSIGIAVVSKPIAQMLLDVTAASAGQCNDWQQFRRARQIVDPERLSRRGQDIETSLSAPQTANVREALFKELHQIIQLCAASRLRSLTNAPQISLPIATAVSAMRFEKPHSLSYQDRTRTNVPSITLVWSRWNTEEWLSWLKSDDTFGLSV